MPDNLTTSACFTFLDGCYQNGATPLDLGTDDTCREMLEHHVGILAALSADPTALVFAAVAHCATLSVPEEVEPRMPLTLRAYQLAPSLDWVPPMARTAIFKWAGYALVAQAAAITQPFAELPDDCADVLEFFGLATSRMESLHVATQCSST